MNRALRLVLVVLSLSLLTAPAHAAPWQWPLGDHRIDRAFDPPDSDYGPGHRGIDLAGRVGQTVRAVAAGRVTFAGTVAGMPTITITHGTERSTYQPVRATVRVGDAVTAGQPIGRLLGGHPSCGGSTCLNLGRLRGDTYLDPAQLLATEGAYRLIDPDGPVPEPPDVASGDLPLDGPVTSAFGMRVHPVTGERKLHDGVDIGAACGTAVPTVAGGVVTHAGPRGPYGLQVEVRHGSGATSYSHLSSVTVGRGQHVAAGTTVGRVGSTGMSTGCHLHFMRLVGGRPVDPLG